MSAPLSDEFRDDAQFSSVATFTVVNRTSVIPKIAAHSLLHRFAVWLAGAGATPVTDVAGDQKI